MISILHVANIMVLHCYKLLYLFEKCKYWEKGNCFYESTLQFIKLRFISNHPPICPLFKLRYGVYLRNYCIKTLFNSCERLLLGTLILDKRNIGTTDLRSGHLSDLIHGITENGLRQASGPVH